MPPSRKAATSRYDPRRTFRGTAVSDHSRRPIPFGRSVLAPEGRLVEPRLARVEQEADPVRPIPLCAMEENVASWDRTGLKGRKLIARGNAPGKRAAPDSTVR